MNDKARLKLINIILSSDIAFEAGVYYMKKKKDKDAEMFAELIMDIYQVAHPSRECPHTDWDRESLKKLKQISK